MAKSHPLSKFTLDSLPPFPADVPTAPLVRISLSKLLGKDEVEINRFTRACEDLGFFYLDLSSPSLDPTFLGQSLLDDADELFAVGERLYDLPVEEKSKYDFSGQRSYFGYKSFGANVDKNGNKDRCEFYNVSKDDIFGVLEKLPAPDVLENQRPLMKSFIQSAHSIVILVLDLLNEHLKLPPGTLQNLHRLQESSGDSIRFVKAPPQEADDQKNSMHGHTDFGSVTVLFNRVGGLQILPPGEAAQWCYVKPLPDHAIINLGDAMVKFTNGLLRSNIHRVAPPPGQQACTTRYSLVYFARPEANVMMKRLNGSDMIPELKNGEQEADITSAEWILSRALGSRHSLDKQTAQSLARTEGTEFISMRTGLRA